MSAPRRFDPSRPVEAHWWIVETGPRCHGTMLGVFDGADELENMTKAEEVAKEMDRIAPGFVHAVSVREIMEARIRGD